MFDLMGAIRQRQKVQTPPPADSAETAESPQPRAGELAEGLRKTADNSGAGIFPATVRKNPQPLKTSEPPETKGLQGFSANPQNPQTPTGKNGYNPDALLLEIAHTLKADAHMLRALLSDDDMQDIAEGATSRAHLLAYFRLMRSDGHPLADDTPEPTRAPQSRPGHVERMKAWKPAHDAMINHLMACPACNAPRARYCTTGAELREVYRQAC